MSIQHDTAESSMQHDRRLQAQFIELYRDRPCLWQPKNQHYRDKLIRMMAYQELLEVYKQIDPEATVDSVRNKLNTLRTLYNREKKKLLGRGRDSSGLWYYDKLDTFLGDIINPTVPEAGAEYSVKADYTPPPQRRRQTIVTDNIKVEILPADHDIDRSYHETYMLDTEKDDTARNPLEHVCVQMESQNNSNAQVTSNSGIEIVQQYNDEFSAFAAVIAASLRKLNNPQQAIAQKLISDVIFFSKLDKLTEDTTIFIPK